MTAAHRVLATEVGFGVLIHGTVIASFVCGFEQL